MSDGRYCLLASVDACGALDADPSMLVVGPFWSGPAAEDRRARLERALTREFAGWQVVVTVEWLHDGAQAARDLVDHMREEIATDAIRRDLIPAS